MSAHHAASGEIVDLRPYGDRLAQQNSVALVRDERIEVMRLVMPAGKVLPEHLAYGPVTIQCIEGAVEVTVHGQARRLEPGGLLYLAAEAPHAVRALQDSSLLVTMVLNAAAA